MRSLRLARIAAQAELLRLRRLGRRQAMRAVMGAIALFFLVACLAALHFAIYFALQQVLAPVYAVLIVAGIDLVIAAFFGVLAMRDVPDRVEREALMVRQSAQQQLAEAAAMTAVVGPVLRAIGIRKVYGLALAALTARYLTGRR
jgi:hypothetical protein